MQRIPVLLGIDGGASTTSVRAVGLENNKEILVTITGGTNLYASSEAEVVTTLESAIANAIKALGHAPADVVIRALCFGTAGIATTEDEGKHRQALFAALSRPGLYVPTQPSRVLSDMDLVLACGRTDRRIGIIAGTGSNACGARYRADGDELTRCHFGGMGLELADDGSAVWVAHMACRRALLEMQGVLDTYRMGRAIFEQLGISPDKPEEWRQLLAVRRSLTKAQLADLTRTVIVPLADLNDLTALELLNQAGRDLALYAKAAFQQLGGSRLTAPDVLLAGSMWKDPRVFRAFVAAFGEFTEHQAHTIHRGVDPTKGAIAIARKLIA